MRYPTTRSALRATGIRLATGVAAGLLVTGVTALPSISPAEEPEEVVIVATPDRVPTSLDRVTTSITVIDREEIERRQIVYALDALRGVPGVELAQSGGPGKVTTVFLRGASSGHAVVLIDGVRVGSSTTGAVNWANLAARDLERIEIVRGPQSTLYGSDAVGGVIQLFTRKGDGPIGGALSAGVGNRKERRIDGRVGGETDAGVRYSLQAGFAGIEGVSAYRDGHAHGDERDPYRNTTVSGHLEVPVGEGALSFTGRRMTGRTDLDGWATDTRGYFADTRESHMGTELRYPLLEGWDLRARVAQYEEVYDSTDPTSSWNDSHIESLSRQASLISDARIGGLHLVTGVDFEREQGENPDADLDERSRQTGLFTRASYTFDFVTIDAGIRREHNSTTEGRTTYQIGTRVNLLPGLHAFASFGTAFKAPSFNDLYWPSSPWSMGNPDLVPERSRGGEVGLRYARSLANALSVEIGGAVFRQEYRDLIQWQTDPLTWTSSPVNVAEAKVRGLELDARFDWRNLWVSGAWTHLDARDGASLRLAHRADDQASLSVGGRWNAFTLEVRTLLVGSRYSGASETSKMSGYQRWDLHGSYDLTDRLSLHARVLNATHRHYEEVKDMGTMGRTYFVSLEQRF